MSACLRDGIKIKASEPRLCLPPPPCVWGSQAAGFVHSPRKSRSGHQARDPEVGGPRCSFPVVAVSGGPCAWWWWSRTRLKLLREGTAPGGDGDVPSRVIPSVWVAPWSHGPRDPNQSRSRRRKPLLKGPGFRSHPYICPCLNGEVGPQEGNPSHECLPAGFLSNSVLPIGGSTREMSYCICLVSGTAGQRRRPASETEETAPADRPGRGPNPLHQVALVTDRWGFWRKHPGGCKVSDPLSSGLGVQTMGSPFQAGTTQWKEREEASTHA